jgi:hypothetical protein
VLVSGIDAEVENVFLRNPHVLNELPRRVLEAGSAATALVRRDPIDGLVKADMSLLPIEEANEMVAKSAG